VLLRGIGCRRRAGAAAFVAVVLGACASDSSKQKIEENVFPDDYKARILRQLRAQLNDPSNIRDAYLAPPLMKVTGATPRYIACVRFSAKDKDGAYEAREMAAYFYAGSLTQITNASPGLCAASDYQPFPELQNL
jgi:hypothetical protein